tara:strand:+ start:720 stop:2048 length:1329 start_codon:yes stop_codon:yes gene_type:complete
MGGNDTPDAPPPLDTAKAGGEYLFGKDFSTSYQGITDPKLQDRLIASEATYRPQYAGLELADINTFASGLAERANPEYARIQAELAGLKAGAESSMPASKGRDAAVKKVAKDLFPNRHVHSSMSKAKRGSDLKYNAEQEKKRQEYFNTHRGTEGVEGRAAKIAELEARLKGMPERLGAQKGLFQLLEDQSVRAANLQRQQLGTQRQEDVAALQKFAPQVVEAYRDADPYSTGLAEVATERANLFNASPTEAEALLSKRGLELASSTGELTPLEQRRSQQAARQAFMARGREMDQSALYGEVQARMAQEMNKEGRDIAMGANLLGQESQLRLSRTGQADDQLARAFNMNRQLAGDAGNVILGRPSAAIGLGGQVLGQAQQGASGQMGPQLFDMNAGINMALQQRGQDINYQGAMAQAKASGSAGGMGAFGSILGGAFSGGMFS